MTITVLAVASRNSSPASVIVIATVGVVAVGGSALWRFRNRK